MFYDEFADIDYMLNLDYAVPSNETGKTIVVDNQGKLFLMKRFLCDGKIVTTLQSYPLKAECSKAKGYDCHSLR